MLTLTLFVQIDDLKEQVTQRRGQNNTYDEELRKARTKLIDFNSKQSELESANAKMKVKYMFFMVF